MTSIDQAINELDLQRKEHGGKSFVMVDLGDGRTHDISLIRTGHIGKEYPPKLVSRGGSAVALFTTGISPITIDDAILHLGYQLDLHGGSAPAMIDIVCGETRNISVITSARVGKVSRNKISARGGVPVALLRLGI